MALTAWLWWQPKPREISASLASVPRTANPVQEVDAAVKRVDAGFSTAQEETATMTGGDYNRNIRQRVIEAKRKREVDEITNPQAKPPGGQQEE